VPDILGQIEGCRIQLVQPGEAGSVAEQVSEIRDSDCAPTLTMHGSTNLMHRDGNVFVEKDFLKAIYRRDAEFLMGIPGPGKSAIAKILRPLWIQARQAIREANMVVFVGYRFPESDAQARSELLRAIRENQSPNLGLQTVLGRNNPDAERLAYLLEAAVGDTAGVEQLPLFAQDYLDVVWTKPRGP
jgi:hypothetical protein